jgi:hypothetical protein
MSARETTIELPPESASDEWPKEADFILSALEAGLSGREDERRLGRVPYRVKGALRLYSDPKGTDPWIIYTRDVCPKSLGFITRHRLPLGYGGMIELPDKSGNILRLDCTLLRCREAAAGWYEGAMYFNRQQWKFSPEEMG